MTMPTLDRLSPLMIRDWIRTTLPIAGVEYVAKELATISEKCAEVGLADPTTSILVTSEMSSRWGLKSPAGWDAAHVEMWKRLPYAVAKYVTERRRTDMLAVRNLQNADAAVKRELERIEGKKAAD
jgi:hypothetical protein